MDWESAPYYIFDGVSFLSPSGWQKIENNRKFFYHFFGLKESEEVAHHHKYYKQLVLNPSIH